MPRPANSRDYVIHGSKKDNPDKVVKDIKPEIGRSVLAVTLGDRLAKRAGPMRNVKGDRTVLDEDDA